MDIKKSVEAALIKQAYACLEQNPEANLSRLIELAGKLDVTGAYEKQLGGVRRAVADPENNWNRLVKSLWTDVDPYVRKTLFQNFVINANFLWEPRREAAKKRYDCNIPWTILIDPTSACNLHCTGCWAAEYGDRLSMDFDTLDGIICQAKELGIHMFLYSGGEPLIRKKDIIALCEKHPDCVFSAFTNGTLIDEAFADEMLRAGNFVPAISVEGFEEATDFRRGNGTFANVVTAMELLRRKKLPFGLSCCYTSKNVESIGSEEYFDWMVDKGAKFCWLFTYMPVGCGAPTDLMATAEQREFMYHRVREFRKTKPIFTMDFWNDGEYVEGCIAGGRNYFHINANGDIEPCAFIHYSDSNVKNKTLVEALQSPLFAAYRSGQPFNENHLRPCPLLDNPGALTAMVEKSGAHSTDLQMPEDVRELSEKCREKAELWTPTADMLWANSHACAICGKCRDNAD
ncbi:Coenzyme PQQ synthesis protein E [bioreactor metagenome]|uniref:Coenzyme PQQ synthesis protein E n=1 Tax=bioreactor metagenome TaxID=1076179 RepID=A0A644X7U9_9ZZZZ